MTHDLLLSLLGYAFVTTVTPGPNNFMLLASGVNFGFRRSIPHILGITLGFWGLLLGVGVGLGALLLAFPALQLSLKLAGAAYLLYLAWKIASARALGQAGQAGAQPLSFLQAAAFQWVNPKAWIMAVTAMAIYTATDHPFLSVFLTSTIFAAVGTPCVAVWAGFGVALRQFLSDPVRLKWFNIAMGVVLALTLWPLLV